MKRIFDIALKDLTQLMRERQTFLFLLLMPVAFTLVFGYAFGGAGKEDADARLLVGYLDLDQGQFSPALAQLWSDSSVVRLQSADAEMDEAALSALVQDKKLAAAILAPAGYSQAAQNDAPLALVVIADPASSAAGLVEAEANRVAYRLHSAIRSARLNAGLTPGGSFSASLEAALSAWHYPPLTVQTATGAAPAGLSNNSMSPEHSAPGMMLQFAIAGLLTAAQIMVRERKSRSLQRLLTTATARLHILLGHYLAIFALIFTQFGLLILFGQLALKLSYFSQPAATLLVALAAALCIAALGLLVGVLAKTDDQAIIFSLIPMFIFAGLGGAWVPLEVTGKTFQAIGHLTPVAWGMDGFKNILVGGLGLDAAWLPAAALAGYGALFFALAAWTFYRAQEK